jgi:ElaB/YqjD/DUF883 family membrane-anchored ribosome-binding protein
LILTNQSIDLNHYDNLLIGVFLGLLQTKKKEDVMENLRNREINDFNKHGTESIDQALKLLDSVAKSHSKEIKQKVVNDYQGLKDVISKSERGDDKKILDYVSNLESTYHNLQNRTVDMARKASTKIDKTAHENPWYFVGGAAIAGSFLGLFLGNRIKGKRNRL